MDRHLVERVALADAPEVEMDVIDGHARAWPIFVDDEFVHAGGSAGGGNQRLARLERLAG